MGWKVRIPLPLFAHRTDTTSRYEVKSYANANFAITPKALSSINSLHSSWSWYYTGHELIANAAYDMFTAPTASGFPEFEIMIWLSSLGGAMPISASGKPIADVNIADSSWKLYDGWNGQMRVYSFVAASNMNNFKADVMEFLRYMISNQGLPANQILQSVHAGTEAFMGYDAVFTTSGYTLSQS
jgi:xyloglucan-specific endo-beta-1,4-glucanase